MITAGIAQAGPNLQSRALPVTTPDRTSRALSRMARQSPHNQSASAGIGMEVAKTGRTNRRFAYMAGLYSSADRQMQMTNLGKLRELCRAHDRGSALISGLLNRALDNIWGDSFAFIPQTGDPDLNKIALEYIKRRMDPKNCDAAQVDDFATMGRTSTRGVWVDGDSLLVFRRDGSMLPFEADQIVTPTERPTGGRSIVLGVQTNRVGRHVRYHVAQRPTTGHRPKTVGVSPSNCLFPAFRTRHRQRRGLPYIGAAMAIFERLDGFIDSETFAAELNARTGVKITHAESESDPDGVKANDDTETNDNFSKAQEFEMGMVFEGKPGEDIGMVESTRPGPMFEPYITTVARIVGASVGFPLELLMLDFSKTNFASGQLGTDEAHRTFRNWQMFSDKRICQPWYERQITRGIATRELPNDPRLYLNRTRWAAWPYIQPQRAATANQIQIANRTKSISEVIREQNKEPKQVFDEVIADYAYLKAGGVPPQMLPIGILADDADNETNGNTNNGNSD